MTRQRIVGCTCIYRNVQNYAAAVSSTSCNTAAKVSRERSCQSTQWTNEFRKLAHAHPPCLARGPARGRYNILLDVLAICLGQIDPEQVLVPLPLVFRRPHSAAKHAGVPMGFAWRRCCMAVLTTANRGRLHRQLSTTTAQRHCDGNKWPLALELHLHFLSFAAIRRTTSLITGSCTVSALVVYYDHCVRCCHEAHAFYVNRWVE